jgi:hypothetical protein
VDDAERWLYFNDPDYMSKSQGWKHVRTGTYVGPSQEIPVGGIKEIERLIEAGTASPIRPVEWLVCARARCKMEFQPTTSWQRYCSELCQQAEAKRRRRAA